MYVRQMWKSDEEWLLTKIEELELNEPAFRSRDYVVAIDSEEGGTRCGFGRVYRYTHPNDPDDHYVKFAHIVALDASKSSRIRVLLYEELFKKAQEYECPTAYVVSDELPDGPFEFEKCDPDGEVMMDEGFDIPEDASLFRADVGSALGEQTEEERLEELAEEFGYDDSTTTKYSVNGR